MELNDFKVIYSDNALKQVAPIVIKFLWLFIGERFR